VTYLPLGGGVSASAAFRNPVPRNLARTCTERESPRARDTSREIPREIHRSKETAQKDYPQDSRVTGHPAMFHDVGVSRIDTRTSTCSLSDLARSATKLDGRARARRETINVDPLSASTDNERLVSRERRGTPRNASDRRERIARVLHVERGNARESRQSGWERVGGSPVLSSGVRKGTC